MFSNDKSFGEIIRDMETSGAFGHFQRMHMNHGVDKETGSFITRDYWIEAGVDPVSVFISYLGDLKQTINNINKACDFIIPVLDRLTKEFLILVKTDNPDLLIRKLIFMLEATSMFYKLDRKTRETIGTKPSEIEDNTLEHNKIIALTVIEGLKLLIENCVVNHRSSDLNKTCFNNLATDKLFDGDLLIRAFLYAWLSRHYTMLNLSKNSTRNYMYCYGIIVDPQLNLPINAIVNHPLTYALPLVMGNQHGLEPENEGELLLATDKKNIGNAFAKVYKVQFSQVIGAFHMLEDICDGETVSIIRKDQLLSYLNRNIDGFNAEGFLNHFSICKSNLADYINDREPFIFRMGFNKNRLDIRPLIRLENGYFYISKAALWRAKSQWSSYAVNGGMPYSGVNVGRGDAIIDGFATRAQDLEGILEDRIMDILTKHYPNSSFKQKRVKYYHIFDRIPGFEDTEDFDIVYLANDELFLIEAKYFSDSPTANLIIGDYNKIFGRKGYYMHCRKRYDLVQLRPDLMKKFIGAQGCIKVHYLFISSKALEIELQDEDKLVTFLNLANFSYYLDGQFKAEDGSTLRPVHKM